MSGVTEIWFKRSRGVSGWKLVEWMLRGSAGAEHPEEVGLTFSPRRLLDASIPRNASHGSGDPAGGQSPEAISDAGSCRPLNQGEFVYGVRGEIVREARSLYSKL